MKLKAPQGVGDPCVAGVTIVPRDGVYEVDADIGALLIECFGFAEAAAVAVAREKGAPGGGRARPAARKP